MSQNFARVITPEQARQLAAGDAVMLSPRAGATQAFITSAGSLREGSSVARVAKLAGLPEDRVGAVVRFHLDDLTGLASPLQSDAAGFVGRGVTSGGIPEFVIANRMIADLDSDVEYFGAMAGVTP